MIRKKLHMNSINMHAKSSQLIAYHDNMNDITKNTWIPCSNRQTYTPKNLVNKNVIPSPFGRYMQALKDAADFWLLQNNLICYRGLY